MIIYLKNKYLYINVFFFQKKLIYVYQIHNYKYFDQMKLHIRKNAPEMVSDLKTEIINCAIRKTFIDTFYQVGAFIGFSYFIDNKISKFEKNAYDNNHDDKEMYLLIRTTFGIFTGLFSVLSIYDRGYALQKYISDIMNVTYYS